MHTLALIFFSGLAAGWIVQALRAYRGMSQIPRIEKIIPASRASLPRISLLFAARDEARKLPAALASLLTLDYPNYEVIAVDDRSSDDTPQILDEVSEQHSRLTVVHVSELPNGWLGKPHALEAAYQRSSGDWLIFTDADVRFAPDLPRRALALAQEKGWDHLTLLAAVDMHGFWEKTAVSYLGFAIVFGAQPWRVSNPRTGSYMGVGAFQLIRRSTYEAIGTHRRLAMEVVDDMKLGKLVKLSGFRSGVAFGGSLVRVRWQEGIQNVIRGLTKNLFAAYGFSPWLAIASVVALTVVSILPFAGALFASGIARLAAAAAAAIAIGLHAAFLRETRTSPLYGFSHPLGAAIFIYMTLRSTIVTLWRGGIVWRATFYRLEELKRGLV